ncbi:MAG: DUF4065 domain-containing protein [Lactobacillus sp.]|jgi:uncharacterized phage-associated protein|nr:DUF4065 domain-containing protein [Lactobacillus sp.]
MYNVFKFVNWLRVRNHADMREDPNIEELTQMKAMKLLYYIQAASLAVNGERLFPDDIVAWKYGPVIPAVHDKYKGQRGIVGEITEKDLQDYRDLEKDAKTADLLNSVYEIYGYSSAYDLMKQTHKEAPWQNTPQSSVISDQAIKNFYSKVFVIDEHQK